MLPRSSNTRGARGQAEDRSRGSRGRGSTSRGAASNSSSRTASNENAPNPFEQSRLENAAKREQRGTNGTVMNGRGGRGSSRGLFVNKQVRFADTLAPDKKEDQQSKSLSPAPMNPFSSSPTFAAPSNIPPRNAFTSNAEQPINPFGTPRTTPNTFRGFGAPSQSSQPPSSTNFFGQPSGSSTVTSSPKLSPEPTSSIFGAPSTAANPFALNPFKTNGISNSASGPGPSKPNPFGAASNLSQTSLTTGLFGQPSGLPAASTPQFPPNAVTSTTGLFGKPSGLPAASTPQFPPNAVTSTTGLFGKPSGLPAVASNAQLSTKLATSIFSAAPTTSTPFGSDPFQANGILNSASGSNPTSSHTNANPLGSPARITFPTTSKTQGVAPSIPFGIPIPSNAPSSISNPPQSTGNGFGPVSKASSQSKFVPAPSSTNGSATSSALANRMDNLLRKQGIIAPKWPTSTPGDPKNKSAVETFWHTSKEYRSKVRAFLIRAGLLDDPDKPKKLSEAIDFKGTCEDMCPEFEKITRIMEHDVQNAEKELAPDGSLWPAPHKMVKALARSAAGQDAPLPMDVRSPAALKRTLDYLLHTVLGEEGELPTVHGFLWDRTRAIRRDFVFQSSMSAIELADQVYCLERITRFHVIALHQMSREEVVAEDFSEQQEVEQLGKALLSLIHAYEDCQVQGIHCENEAEFRAYYVLFNSHNSGILETVQDWGYKFWGESEEVRIACNLVEALQNIWDTVGPLKPHTAMDISQNGYSRFFSIIENNTVSYTMACFAEIHFNSVRKSALKTILASYRKQRDQTTDWTLTKLNAYLRFDDEEDIISFGESYGLQFEEIDGESYLSFESGDALSDPFPLLKQRHSYSLVERKRGDNSLPVVIDKTVYEEESLSDEGSEDQLFVKDHSSNGNSATSFHSQQVNVDEVVKDTVTQEPISTPAIPSQPMLDMGRSQKPISIFDRIATPSPSFGAGFFTPKPAETLEPAQSKVQETRTSFSKQPGQKTPTLFGPSSQTKSPNSPTFLFPQQPITSTSIPQSTQPPTFPFAQQPAVQLTNESVKSPLSTGQHGVSAKPLPENPKPQLSLGQHSVVPPHPSTKDPSAASGHLAPPPNQTKQSPFVQPPSSPSLVPSPLRTPFYAGTSQVPLQESKSSSAPPAQKQISLLPLAEPPPTVSRKVLLDNVANWFALGPEGLLDQFTSFMVERIVRNAERIFLKEQADRAAKEADDLARQEADHFRHRSLATKYGHLWREQAHRMWQRRKGREARRARKEMAESFRASKATQSTHLVEDFRASTRHSRRGSLESLLDATGVLNGVHGPNEQLKAITQGELPQPNRPRRRTDRSTESPASSTNILKRGKPDDPLRRSMFSDPSYLQGGSRIHLMASYDAKDETRRQVSGVQTDYFRLKARGITTLPGGTPLASSVAKNLLQHKRSFDGFTTPATPKLSDELPAPRSVPTNPMADQKGWRTSAERDEDIKGLKCRARAVLDEDKESRERESRQKNQKRALDSDEELFARAKRIKEQMDEGAAWYKEKIAGLKASRSVS